MLSIAAHYQRTVCIAVSLSAELQRYFRKSSFPYCHTYLNTKAKAHRERGYVEAIFCRYCACMYSLSNVSPSFYCQYQISLRDACLHLKWKHVATTSLNIYC